MEKRIYWKDSKEKESMKEKKKEINDKQTHIQCQKINDKFFEKEERNHRKQKLVMSFYFYMIFVPFS